MIQKDADVKIMQENIWFTEELEIVQGFQSQIRIKKVLHTERTPFQDLAILETTDLGRMMVLDGVIMLTEFDEFAYHEMIVHPALFAHSNPLRMLVIGGGDGGAVREAARHSCLQQIDLCELDERVVEVSKEFLPGLASAYADPRVNVHYMDGAEWMRRNQASYDVIIVDSTDPVGPGKVLFEEPFYRDCRGALREGGVLVTQAENFFLHLPIIKELMENGRRLFPVARYYYTQVPTYPGGMIGFTFLSKGTDPINGLQTAMARTEVNKIAAQLKYWTPMVHASAFELPAFVTREIYSV